MVTEGLPLGCVSCFEYDSLSTRRPSTSSRSLNPADGLAGIIHGGSRTNSSSSEKENGVLVREALESQSATRPSTIETPPESPRVATLQKSQLLNSHKRDSSFRKTYDEKDKKRA